MPITVGDAAPDFQLAAVTRSGETKISLAEAVGKVVVLYFYPKDDTPGCTTQACGFRDFLPEFEAAGGVIWGVSPDTLAAHTRFAENHALPFPLLTDPDHAASEFYGAWKEKINYGKTYWGIERTTFVIDTNGKIAKIYPRVKVDAHAQKVLDFVRSLNNSEQGQP